MTENEGCDRVMGSPMTRRLSLLWPENREWVTSIECANIYKTGSVTMDYLPGKDPY